SRGLIFMRAFKVTLLNTDKMKGYHEYQSCIEACLQCAAICNHCATSCLGEEHVHMMTRCIQLDRECATLCLAAAQLMSMGSEHAAAICRICADACEACAAECANHDDDHCRECAEACRKCAAECRSMSGAA